MTKRVLLFTENFPPIEGGSGRWFWELYSRLAPSQVVVLTHDVDDAKTEEIDKRLSSPVIRIPLQSSEWGLRSKTGLSFYWKTVRRLKRVVKEFDIDEIHCGRVIHEGVSAWLLSFLGGPAYRCFIHGEDVETAATSREQAMMVKQVCKSATSLICNSENSKSLTQSFGFDDGNKCEVLHPGADLNKFTPHAVDDNFKQAMGWEGRFVILTVGRLQQRKGQDFLIEALLQIKQAIPNCLYVIIGSGELEAELKRRVEVLKLNDYVQFLAGLDDATLVACYQQCDRFVLPNRTIGNDIEGFGMVLVEAQACGKPVIAGNSGGTKETMDIGRTGEIIDCSSPENLAAEIVPLLKHEPLDPSIYREYAEQRFKWESHVERFLQHIQKN